MVQEEGRESGDGINSKLDDLIRKIDLVVPDKKFKEKTRGKLKIKKLSKGKLKKNYVIVLYIGTNLELSVKYVPIEDNAVYIKESDTFYPLTSDFIIRHKGNPVLLLHGDALTPVHPNILRGERTEVTSMYQKILFALLKKAQINEKKKKASIGSIIVIVVIIAIVIGAFFLFKK